jgi:fermentation-respiration switch protein FrsA (DUF1100 family)
VAHLRDPVLVWHGEQDEQVPMRSIEGFVEAAQLAGAPREDRDALSVITARFLAGCLGGRAEEWDALPAGAVLEVEGADRLPGLTQALVDAGIQESG